MIKARVFEKDGNRFITPMYAGNAESESPYWGQDGIPPQLFAMMANLTDTGEWLEFEDGAEIRNRPINLCSPGFAHGAISLICIGGPLLEETA